MATQALARADDGQHPIVKLENQLSQRLTEFKKVLPAHITPEKLQRTILTAVQSDPELLKADRQSFMVACMKAAQDGLLPDKREAALVIFKENKKVGNEWQTKLLVQYMPMVYGLRKKILQSGEIKDLVAKVVYRREEQEGRFVYEEGTEAMLRHRPLLDLTEEEASDDNIIAAYSMAIHEDGSKVYEVMRRFEINKVREKSQTGALRDRKGQSRNPSGPWVEWFPEQAKKTVIRRHSKTLPMSGDLLDVEARDDAIYAASTTQVLAAVDPDAPKLTPPTRDEIASEEEQIDEQTGEVLSEEEIARRLDAETEAAREGRTDEQHGDQHDGVSDSIADQLIGRIEAAEVIGDVIGIEGEYQKAGRAMMDVPDQDRVETAIGAAKAKFGKGK